MAASKMLVPKDLATCTICLNLLSDPVTLPCEHSFCKQCIAETVQHCLFKNGDDESVCIEASINVNIICPNCSTEQRNVQSVSSFKTPLFLRQFLDHCTPNDDNEDSDEVDEELCSAFGCERPAKLQCVQCDVLVCKHCYDARGKFEACKNADHPVLEKKKENIYACLKHGISVDLFCTQCKMVICLDCFLTEHKCHNTQTVKSVKDDALSVISKYKSIRNENSSNRKKIDEKINEMMQHCESNEEELLAELKNFQLNALKNVFHFFEEKRTEIHEVCQQHWRGKLTGIEKLSKKIKDDEKLIKSSKVVNLPDSHELKIVANLDFINKKLNKSEATMKEIDNAVEEEKRVLLAKNLSKDSFGSTFPEVPDKRLPINLLSGTYQPRHAFSEKYEKFLESEKIEGLLDNMTEQHFATKNKTSEEESPKDGKPNYKGRRTEQQEGGGAILKQSINEKESRKDGKPNYGGRRTMQQEGREVPKYRCPTKRSDHFLIIK